jgi:hypothetical protein
MLCLLGNPETLKPEVNVVAIKSLALIIEKLLLSQTESGKPSSAEILDIFEVCLVGWACTLPPSLSSSLPLSLCVSAHCNSSFAVARRTGSLRRL